MIWTYCKPFTYLVRIIETTDPLTDAMMGGLLSYVDQLDTAVGQSGLAVE